MIPIGKSSDPPWERDGDDDGVGDDDASLFWNSFEGGERGTSCEIDLRLMMAMFLLSGLAVLVVAKMPTRN